jgi:hypothetical protein
MKKSTGTTKEILDDIFSEDSHRIWKASCEIVSLSQDRNRMIEFVPHLNKIKRKTKNVDLGGAFAPNNRFLNKAINAIEFHKRSEGSCSCCLLGEDSNPKDEEINENMVILEKYYMEGSNYIDYYIVECKLCGKKYRVEEREYHYTWWKWVSVPS